MLRESTHALIITIWLLLTASVALATGDCSDCTDLTGMALPITVSSTTDGATGDYTPFNPSSDPPGCWHGGWDWGCALGPDVTFKWRAPHDGRFT